MLFPWSLHTARGNGSSLWPLSWVHTSMHKGIPFMAQSPPRLHLLRMSLADFAGQDFSTAMQAIHHSENAILTRGGQISGKSYFSHLLHSSSIKPTTWDMVGLCEINKRIGK